MKYSVGRAVRISFLKGTFERGYENNFSKEIFRIKRVSRRRGLFIYILEDLNKKEIDVFFYKEEIVQVGSKRVLNGTFEIEKIIRTKGQGSRKLALVRWENYPPSFDSWIKYSDVKTI